MSESGIINLAPKVVRKGEYLMREGDSGKTAYLVKKGQLQVFMKRKGQRYQLALLGHNEIVGEMALIDQMPRSASVIALEDSVIVPIDLSKLGQIMQAQPDLALLVVRLLVKKIRATNNLLTKGGRYSELGFWYRIGSILEQWGLLMKHIPEGDPAGRPFPDVLSRSMAIPVEEAVHLTKILKSAGLLEDSARCFGIGVCDGPLSLFLRTYENNYGVDEEDQENTQRSQALVSRVALDWVRRLQETGELSVTEGTEEGKHTVNLGDLQRTLLRSAIMTDLDGSEREARIRAALLRLQRAGIVERNPPTSDDVIMHAERLEAAAEDVEMIPIEFHEISTLLLGAE